MLSGYSRESGKLVVDPLAIIKLGLKYNEKKVSVYCTILYCTVQLHCTMESDNSLLLVIVGLSVHSLFPPNGYLLAVHQQRELPDALPEVLLPRDGHISEPALLDADARTRRVRRDPPIPLPLIHHLPRRQCIESSDLSIHILYSICSTRIAIYIKAKFQSKEFSIYCNVRVFAIRIEMLHCKLFLQNCPESNQQSYALIYSKLYCR